MAYTGEIETRLKAAIYAAVEAEVKRIAEKHNGKYDSGMLTLVLENFGNSNANGMDIDLIASVMEDAIMEWESDTESNFGDTGFDGGAEL